MPDLSRMRGAPRLVPACVWVAVFILTGVGCNTGPLVDRSWPEPFPVLRLSTDHLDVAVMPHTREGSFYRGTRFERSGMILVVETPDRRRFFGPVVPPDRHDPRVHDHVAGTAEEFDIESPPGYTEATAGEPFVKIGVGLLRRPDEQRYRFGRLYDIVDPGQWSSQATDRSIHTAHVLPSPGSPNPDGWGYRYTKTVSLSDTEPSVTIDRTLTNTGMRRLTTEHYGHHFTVIDGLPVGPAYRVDFSFDAHAGRVRRNPGISAFDSGSLIFLREPQAKEKMWIQLAGVEPTRENRISVHQSESGSTLSITQPSGLSRVVMWASRPYLSPEMFTAIDLAPGESFSWSTVYRFTSGDVWKKSG